MIRKLQLCAIIIFALGIGQLQAQTNKSSETVTDVDGNVYHTVVIGTQTWMVENLKTTRYRNGDSIGTTYPATLNIKSESNQKYQWAYNGNESNVAIYGRLYTWYAATNSRGLCPNGWHVPTREEWLTLTSFLGGQKAAYEKLKEAGTLHWNSPNSDASNETGFTVLPGGGRFRDSFQDLGICTHFWTSSEFDSENAFRILFTKDTSPDCCGNYSGCCHKRLGWSIRCIKD